MTKHSPIFPVPAEPDQIVGRGTRIPDVPRLLAVLAARQRILPTATAMRTREEEMGPAPADRMVRLLVTPDQSKRAAAGPFNGGTARFLAGEQSEGDVYRGA